MPVTGLDHVMLAVPDLPAAVDAIAGSLGLRAERGVQHPDFGTRNRTVRIPGLYLELITFTDRETAVRRPVGVRMAELIDDDGGGWLAAVLGVRDMAATVADVRAAGIPIEEPHVGRAVRPDGTVRRWWLAGHDDDFRAGRTPSLIEYEATGTVDPSPDDLGYHLAGVARVDLATDDLEASLRRFRALLGYGPASGPECGTATFDLPDGAGVRLLGPGSPERGRARRPGLAAIALAVDDVVAATRAVEARGVATAPAAEPGEVSLDPARTAGARFSFRPAAA
jgi:catechol 2,3-dioxygenase-like lactoylglutathione lyase family enzyme